MFIALFRTRRARHIRRMQTRRSGSLRAAHGYPAALPSVNADSLRTFKGAAALVMAVVACGSAVAVPIRFDNPVGAGNFDWTNKSLEITQSPFNQSNIGSVSTFSYELRITEDPFFNNGDGLLEFNGVVSPGFTGAFAASNGSIAIAKGTLIGPGGLIPSGAAGGVFLDRFVANQPFSSSSIAPPGPTYFGVSFQSFDNAGVFTGTHFGWIGVELSMAPAPFPLGSLGNIHTLALTSYGYETQPDTAIAIGVPSPGALPLLTLGALTLGARRRRTSRQ